MEYTNEIIINLPRKKTLELLFNPKFMKQWSPSLKSYTLVEGKRLTKGCKAKMIFETYEGEMEMQETVLENNLPKKVRFLYETHGVKNWSTNQFEEISSKKTKWIAHNIFHFDFQDHQDNNLTQKQFSEQTMKDMSLFKQFAERTRI